MQHADINNERSVRIEKLEALRDEGIAAYPADSGRKHSIKAASEKKHDARVQVAGRIMMKRDFGKLTFCHLQDESGRMQIALKKNEMKTEEYKLFLKKIDIGDIVEIKGVRFKTNKGEESILAKKWTLLAKALRPLPDKFHGLQDEETRLRKRYLEFISDPEARDLFYKKAMFWSSTRAFLQKKGFLEVETPVLEPTAGGADATPFSTHHNALDMDVFLRISMGELWQKRLMVAGFEKTFEIGRQFRNEGMSREHLQDYTQMEFYWAYANYEDGMKLVEQMYKYIIEKTFGTMKFNINGFKNIDFSKEWKKVSYVDTLNKHFSINVMEMDEKQLRKKLKEEKVKAEDGAGRGRLIDLLWKQVRKTIKGPVFIVDLPVDVSPLAKRKKDNPDLVERYQILIAGSELGNGYSELNDPIDQAGRFEEQAKLREAGDSEAQMHDQDFVEALEYGMPPTTGFGFSERLFSFLVDKPIREAVLFPLMKPVENDDV